MSRFKFPEEWNTSRLDALAKRVTGHTPTKKKPSYWNGGIKWVSLADSYRLDKTYISETENTISDEGLKHSSAVLHPKGTVILSRDAGVGKSAILNTPMAVSQHFVAWICNAEHLNNLFLYYWMQLHKKEFERMAVGSTIKTIGMGYFEDLEISVPQIREQNKIAEILSTWDRAIEMVEQLLTLQQKAKRAIGLQVFSEGKLTPLKELLRNKIEYGANARAIDYKTDVTPRYIRITDIDNNGRLIKGAQKGISPQEADGYILEPRDVLIARSGNTVGKSYIHREGNPKSAFAGYLLRVRTDETKLLPEFLFSYLQSQIFWNWVKTAIRAGAQPNINADEYSQLQIPLREVEEQRELLQVFGRIDQLLFLLSEQKLKLIQQKQGLMQKLLTGELRVTA